MAEAIQFEKAPQGKPNGFVGPGWYRYSCDGEAVVWATREGEWLNAMTVSFTAISHGREEAATSLVLNEIFDASAVLVDDPAIGACAEFARVWHACVLSDEDPGQYASWDAEMAATEETLVEIVPTTIEGAAALLGVVRLRMRGSMGDEFDHALISNVETGLRGLSAA